MEYLTADKNKKQTGLIYQENTIAQLKEKLEGKEIETPTIMYNINYDDSLNLFKSSVFNNPRNFSILPKNSSQKYQGYNEIDYSFILSDDIEINQNFIFNKTVENDEIQENFEPKESTKIKFPKNTNIFVEIKVNIKDILVDKNNNTIIKSDRFAKAFENVAFTGIEKKFFRNNHQYYLLYDNIREDGIKLIKKKMIDREINVYYNSGYAQISLISSLQNQIREMNNRLTTIENEKKEMLIQFKMMNINNEIFKFKVKNNSTKIEAIQNVINIAEKSSIEKLEIFKNINSKYMELCNKILDKDDLMINISENIIGKFLESKEELDEFFRLLQLLDKKINENTFVKCYYQYFKDILTGPEFGNLEKYKKIDLFSRDETSSSAIKGILKCILTLENDEELENYFYQAVLFFASKIKGLDNYFALYSKKNDVKKTVIDFILSLNGKFHEKLTTNSFNYHE